MENESEKLQKTLIQMAMDARKKAYAPFSNFRVGAVLMCQSGKIFEGCNIENASYGLTLCAERLAIFKAVSENARDFTHLVVVADTKELCSPCGACRQIIWEFAREAQIILANLSGKIQTFTIQELLPLGFDASSLTETS